MKYDGPIISQVRGIAVFPGGIAGASLKFAGGAHAAPGDRAVFPGGIAGASLKWFGNLFGGDAVAGFPRRNRRGLIEVSPLP